MAGYRQARKNFGNEIGNVNTSWHFPREFACSLITTVQKCITAMLHMRIPATGLPSDLTRVVDGISAQSGESLFAVIHVRTNVSGDLKWDLLDLRNVGLAPKVLRNASLPHFALHGA
jgi:hypothetical protein